MTSYELKDSGNHQNYGSGMRRSSEEGKPRFDLIRTRLQPYEEQMIYRYAIRLSKGAAVYDARNWEEGSGQEELDHAISSLLRHVEQLVAGETDEDHAAAVWFNAQAIEYFRWRMDQGKPETDEAALECERRARESEIRNAALKEAHRMRRKERLEAASKEFDAELNEDARRLAEEADANRPVPAAQQHLFQNGRLPVAGYAARWINDYDPGEKVVSVETDNTSVETVALAAGMSVDDLLEMQKRIDKAVTNRLVHQSLPYVYPLPFRLPTGFLQRFGYEGVTAKMDDLEQQSTTRAMLKSVVEANERSLELLNRDPHPSQVSEDGETVTYQVVARYPTTLERASELRRQREAEMWNALPKPWDVTSKQQGPLDPIDRGE